MRRIKYIILSSVFFSFILTACTKGNDKINIENPNLDYEYSNYEFNNDEAQYYMKPSAAAAEDGYYYIAKAPVSSDNYLFIYYFDMVSKNTVPLCSKLDCEHTGEDCDAYLSNEKCLGKSIWYYNHRLYMIERTAEKDILVSYDKNGRDKKNCEDLSIDGLSVHMSNSKSYMACVSHGKLFYFVTDEKAQYLYEVSLLGGEEPQLIKKYESETKIRETMSLYAIGDKVYVNLTRGITEVENNFIVDCYDISDETITNKIDYVSDHITVRGQINSWNMDVYYDNENNMYFVSISEGDFIVNKLNLDSKECKELYVIETSESNNDSKTISGNSLGAANLDTDYIFLKGYDGKFLYVYKGINISSGSKIQTQDLNYMYVIDTNGNLVDTITLAINESEHNMRSSNNIDINYLGGDARYMLITTSQDAVTGLELKEKWINKYADLVKNIKKGGSVSVCSVGAFNKSQLGTGEYQWNNITFE